MGIVSYAQNFEDVILWRALGNVSHGTYVDVGAHHPDIDSVSRAFHDRGWHGVHVEPGPEVAALLREKRPGDTIIQAIVSDETGVRHFYETPGGGLSTADRDIAQFHVQQGHAPVAPTSVVAVTLDQVLDQVPGDDIHWMKIDVEGFERRVLLSWQTSARRPWIIVIEATYPKTRTSMHHEWEEIILSKGYSFAYDDGLNRFYLSNSHADLRERLIHPPNVFDEFQINPSGSSAFSQDMKAFMEGEILAREHRIDRLTHEAGQQAADLRAQLAQAEQHAAARTEQLVEQARIVASQNSRLTQLEADVAAMKSVAAEFEARDVLIRKLLARSLADHALPWPLRNWRPHAGGSALGGLLALPDRDFVDSAYRSILGREADPHGKAHYLTKLAGGCSRSWLLDNLARSTEARTYAEGSDLAGLTNEDFVDAAYQRALGRASDPEGVALYTEQLKTGLSRAELMQALFASSEGRERDGGLRQEINSLVRRRRSLLGWRTWLQPRPLPPL